MIFIMKRPAKATYFLAMVSQLLSHLIMSSEVSHQDCLVFASRSQHWWNRTVPGERTYSPCMSRQSSYLFPFSYVPYLNLSALGPYTQMVSTVGPAQRSDLVFFWHRAKLLNRWSCSVPHIDWVFKSYCKDVLRRPINQVEVKVITKAWGIKNSVRVWGDFPWFDRFVEGQRVRHSHGSLIHAVDEACIEVVALFLRLSLKLKNWRCQKRLLSILFALLIAILLPKQSLNILTLVCFNLHIFRQIHISILLSPLQNLLLQNTVVVTQIQLIPRLLIWVFRLRIWLTDRFILDIVLASQSALPDVPQNWVLGGLRAENVGERLLWRGILGVLVVLSENRSCLAKGHGVETTLIQYVPLKIWPSLILVLLNFLKFKFTLIRFWNLKNGLWVPRLSSRDVAISTRMFKD